MIQSNLTHLVETNKEDTSCKRTIT